MGKSNKMQDWLESKEGQLCRDIRFLSRNSAPISDENKAIFSNELTARLKTAFLAGMEVDGAERKTDGSTTSD